MQRRLYSLPMFEEFFPGHMTSMIAMPVCGDLRGYIDVCTYDALQICGVQCGLLY